MTSARRAGARGRGGPAAHPLPLGLAIVHEDRDLLVVNKPPGLLTIGTARERSRTVYHMITEYVRKGNPKSRNRIFIVHRLDRDTSGLLVFAKTEQAKRRLQDSWDKAAKRYLAVVNGHMEKKADTISTLLAENSAHVVHTTHDRRKGKLSHTAYRVLKQTKSLSLLEVDLLTGRKHQIRVHLAEIGHPVVGDRRYGEDRLRHKHLALHAWSLSFPHPFSGAVLSFEADPPRYFTTLVGQLPRARGGPDPELPA